jgi:hypothetical protein
VFENRVLRRIFGSMMDDVTGEGRKLQRDELHNLYSFPIYHSADQVKANEVDRACSMHGKGEKSVQGFGGIARRKETTPKTRDWLGGCGLDLGTCTR